MATKAQEKMIAEIRTYNRRGIGFFPYRQERAMIKRLIKSGLVIETIEDGFFLAEYKQPKVTPQRPESEPVPQMWLEMTVELPEGAIVINLYRQKRTIQRFCKATERDIYALMHTFGKKPTDFYLLSYRHISKLVSVNRGK